MRMNPRDDKATYDQLVGLFTQWAPLTFGRRQNGAPVKITQTS